MVLPVCKESICQLAVPWGTRHLMSPELAGHVIILHAAL